MSGGLKGDLAAALLARAGAERELRQAAAVIDAELVRLRLVLVRVSDAIDRLEERQALVAGFLAGLPPGPGEAHV